jgi:hypothetical protein
MSPSTAKHLIDEIAKLDLIATQLAGPIGELNRDRILGPNSLMVLGQLQADIASLRRYVHEAGALKAVKLAA